MKSYEGAGTTGARFFILAPKQDSCWNNWLMVALAGSIFPTVFFMASESFEIVSAVQ